MECWAIQRKLKRSDEIRFKLNKNTNFFKNDSWRTSINNRWWKEISFKETTWKMHVTMVYKRKIETYCGRIV